MTDGQDVRALLKSIGGLKRRVAEMDRQVERMRAMNAGAYAEELGRLAEGLRAEYAHALALIEAVPDAAGREVLELRYLSGLTWMQIARRMGYEERQVRRIHQRALQCAADVRAKGDRGDRKAPV